ncbi:S-adenosyl-L-methionine-dependent methyltransferase [Neolentinus lepideus HHB14362 ss-1]|uniref:S-adenosyl-L-methionine-dependent methyltransferase n=1 Tax=Neolentinus lepideus HHB14362 ss-1 TaxID=1314782 RepID=A0A165ULQ5_9AGAM|nr:S-adenosyl-L-methionine-dependent methyltransferase [Neolentinus lepideus HHB14362 ss-1]
MSTELEGLQVILNDALNAIQAELTIARLPALSNCAQIQHPLDDLNYLPSPRLYEARRLAIAAMGQLKNLLQQPFEKVREHSLAIYDSACLEILLKTGVLDYLADPSRINGAVQVSDMRTALNLGSLQLEVILRHLCSMGLVHEPQEGAFALCRPALELREGSSGRAVVMVPGRAKVASALVDLASHSESERITPLTRTAFQHANNTDLSLFSFLSDRTYERQQWSASISAYGTACRAATVVDFPWQELDGRLFIDCGGGQGELALDLLKILPHSEFIVQDLPEVVSLTQAHIERRAPTETLCGRIRTEVHNFFSVQQYHRDDTVFVLRHILHNWSNDSAVTILKNIAAGAGTCSKVLIIEMVISPCSTANWVESDVPVTLNELRDAQAYRPLSPPQFIPSNFGAASHVSTAAGVNMNGYLNARERTLSEWIALVSNAGLTLKEVVPLRANESIIVCQVLGS